jgi:hypothetical protein
MWDALYAHDQLAKEIHEERAMSFFEEGKLIFRPTFKVRRQKGIEYLDQRIPAYCDRVLWRSLPAVKDDLEIHVSGCVYRDARVLSIHSPYSPYSPYTYSPPSVYAPPHHTHHLTIRTTSPGLLFTGAVDLLGPQSGVRNLPDQVPSYTILIHYTLCTNTIHYTHTLYLPDQVPSPPSAGDALVADGGGQAGHASRRGGESPTGLLLPGVRRDQR